PPVAYKNLVIYMFGTGEYVPKGTGIYVMRSATKLKEIPKTTEGEVSWLYSHDNPFYPPGHKALVRAWDIETGKEVWTKDFSELGSGGDDATICLMNDTLYYSCFFGYMVKTKGVTAAMDPLTGRVLWQTTQYYATQGCAMSGENGRLYLGGYNPPDEKATSCYVHCLNAADGSLIWRSEPVTKAINVSTVGRDFIVAYAYGGDTFVIDKKTGKIWHKFNDKYACTRFTLSGPYLLGTNVDMIDVSSGNKLVSTGPALDPRECVGASVSNGRIYYTGQASGLQLCATYGSEAAAQGSPWK
ncbi:PQQ-binding-like beta-propeller repeat protein, partial [Candidatus Sumerlaeota bacterium]|nr:PQQ-binding-like beta-propeller repeat protein [Candidatus Sumerlaeota bacterium]